jgi:hypothetical protein
VYVSCLDAKTVTRLYTDMCHMTGSHWYTCACHSRMRCPQKVSKHPEILYPICVNKFTLLTSLEFSVLFVYIYLFIYFPFRLYFHAENPGSTSEGFPTFKRNLPRTSAKLTGKSNCFPVSKIKCRGDVFVLDFIYRSVLLSDQ